MAKITRAFQKIFADGITPTGNIAVFGSLAVGSPAYSKDPATIQSLAPWSQGWSAATLGNKSPAFQDFNGYQYLVTRQLASIFQDGIPEWETNTIYFTGNFCSVAGVIYRSKIDNNQGNAVGENASWGILLSPVATSGSYNDLTNKPTAGLAKAWCRWNRTSGIISSNNVTGVTINGSNRPVVALAGGTVANGNYIVNCNSLRASVNPMQTYAITRTTSSFVVVGYFSSGEDPISDFDVTVFG